LSLLAKNVALSFAITGKLAIIYYNYLYVEQLSSVLCCCCVVCKDEIPKAVNLRLRSYKMNKDEASGNWKQLKGKFKEKWGKLTDDDLTVVEGKRDQLVGKIQERYGYGKEQAEKELGEWETHNNHRF